MFIQSPNNNKTMTTQNIKKTFAWTAGISGLLSIILLIHIIMVTKPQKTDNATLQLSRITLSPAHSDLEISTIINNLRNTEGVKTVNYFSEQSVLVTAFDNMLTDNITLMDCIQSLTSAQVNIEIPGSSALSKGCPFGAGESLSGRISMVVKKLFY